MYNIYKKVTQKGFLCLVKTFEDFILKAYFS